MITLNQILLLLYIGLNMQVAGKPKNVFPVTDTINSKSWEYLSHAVVVNNRDSIKSRIYLEAWLKKAKEKSDYKQMAQAYRVFSYKAASENQIKYADSMLKMATKTSDNLLIGTAYLTRGIAYYNTRELRKALDNYLKADKYVAMTENEDAIFMVKYTLALTKYQIGFYDEAIALFNECLSYYKIQNDRAYLNTLHALALCHNKVENYGKASKLNAFGIKEGEELADTIMSPYFRNAEGINQFSKGNYAVALNMLLKSLPHIKKKKDFPNEAITSYYIGKAYWKLNKKGDAMSHLHNVDKIFQDKKYIRRDLRETFEILIEYYQSKNDLDAVLKHVNTLLLVDRSLTQDQYYLVPKVIKEYDTAKLLEVKAKTEQVLQSKNRTKSVIITALILVAIGLIFRHYRIKKKYISKFQELMVERNTLPKVQIPAILTTQFQFKVST